MSNGVKIDGLAVEKAERYTRRRKAFKFNLMEEERQTLEELSVNHWHWDKRRRAIGLLLLAKGGDVAGVACELGVTIQTVYNWMRAWSVDGVVGLLGGHKGGRPYAISELMQSTAIQVTRGKLLTLKQIARNLEAAHGSKLPCKIRTLANTLRRLSVPVARARGPVRQSPRVEESFDAERLLEMHLFARRLARSDLESE
ncbi:helix-turn-helix domain-containing protein [Burkholderia sp. JSH-S8]|nr:helix-turn-helix domain-containing protein [Burkholderia sp. JSH-S8]